MSKEIEEIKTKLIHLNNCPICGANFKNVNIGEYLDVRDHNEFDETVMFFCPICDVTIEMKIFESWK